MPGFDLLFLAALLIAQGCQQLHILVQLGVVCKVYLMSSVVSSERRERRFWGMVGTWERVESG